MKEINTIIAVEDERMALEYMLDDIKAVCPRADVRGFSNAGSALLAMEEKPCDLLLTDIRMHGMNGAELAAEVLERFPDTEIGFVTGETEKRIMELGIPIERCLMKPVIKKRLAAKIEEITGGNMAPLILTPLVEESEEEILEPEDTRISLKEKLLHLFQRKNGD